MDFKDYQKLEERVGVAVVFIFSSVALSALYIWPTGLTFVLCFAAAFAVGEATKIWLGGKYDLVTKRMAEERIRFIV